MFYLSKDISGLLKLVSAFVVVLTHYLRMKALAGHELNWFEWLVRSQGHVAVAVFFFLSGYGLMSSELREHLSLSQFFRRRFCKIYLPVVAVTVLWLPLLLRYNEAPGSVWAFCRLLLWDFGDSVMWFMKNLLVLYAGFAVFAYFLHAGKRVATFVVFCAMMLATGVQSYYCNGDFWIHSLSGIPLFAVGVVAALYRDRYFMGLHVAFVPLLLGLLSVLAIMWFYPRFIPNSVHTLADFMCVGTILVVFSRYRPSVKVLPVLSMLTFDVYLVHFKVLVVMTENGGEISPVVYFAAVLAVAALFGLFRIKIQEGAVHRALKRVFGYS